MTTNYREDAARAVIEAHLKAPVSVHDDGSRNGMYDLAIHYEDGRTGAVEVTSAEDPDRAARQAAISRKPLVTDPRLSQGWLVMLAENAKVDYARRHLPLTLVAMEEAGIQDLSVWDSGDYEGEQDWARDLLRQAHVHLATATATGTGLAPGQVGIMGPMQTSWMSTDPDSVVAFAEEFVGDRPADVDKLARSGADERHLFIWSGVFSTGLEQLRPLGLDQPHLPQRAPVLPTAVTHLWIANEFAGPCRIVHWSPAAGWVEAGRTGMPAST